MPPPACSHLPQIYITLTASRYKFLVNTAVAARHENRKTEGQNLRQTPCRPENIMHPAFI